MDTIKCQRTVFELRAGDTILDNGFCLQLTSRPMTKGFFTTIPLVSKKAFSQFKKLKNVKNYPSESNEIWVYE